MCGRVCVCDANAFTYAQACALEGTASRPELLYSKQVGANPNCKGVGMIAAIDALLSDRERFEPAIDETLRHYLNEQLDPIGWYPSEHLIGLVSGLLVVAPLSEMPREAAFELFGALSARRDVRDDQEMVPKKRRSTLSGAYVGAISKQKDLVTTLNRMLAIWQLYWDEGEQIAERLDERTVRVRTRGCAPTMPELCWLHTGFYKEAFQLADVVAQVEKTRCSARGDARCEWTVRFPEVDPAELASLPDAAQP